MTFEHDSIVPRASAADLLERAGSRDKHELHLSGGHVGAVVSRGAAKKLWPALSDFWSARETPAASPRSASGAQPARPSAPEAPRGSGGERESPPCTVQRATSTPARHDVKSVTVVSGPATRSSKSRGAPAGRGVGSQPSRVAHAFIVSSAPG